MSDRELTREQLLDIIQRDADIIQRDAIELNRLMVIERAAKALVAQFNESPKWLNDQVFQPALGELRALLDAREADRQAWLKAHGFRKPSQEQP